MKKTTTTAAAVAAAEGSDSGQRTHSAAAILKTMLKVGRAHKCVRGEAVCAREWTVKTMLQNYTNTHTHVHRQLQ